MGQLSLAPVIRIRAFDLPLAVFNPPSESTIGCCEYRVSICLNDRGFDVQAFENELERVAYRGQARTGRTGDRNDGMLWGHGWLFPRIGQQAAEQKE
jgi:hypothetical protein